MAARARSLTEEQQFRGVELSELSMNCYCAIGNCPVTKFSQENVLREEPGARPAQARLPKGVIPVSIKLEFQYSSAQFRVSFKSNFHWDVQQQIATGKNLSSLIHEHEI